MDEMVYVELRRPCSFNYAGCEFSRGQRFYVSVGVFKQYDFLMQVDEPEAEPEPARAEEE